MTPEHRKTGTVFTYLSESAFSGSSMTQAQYRTKKEAEADISYFKLVTLRNFHTVICNVLLIDEIHSEIVLLFCVSAKQKRV